MQEVFSTSLARAKSGLAGSAGGGEELLAVFRRCPLIRWLSVFQVVQAGVALEALAPMLAKTIAGDGH